MLYSNGKIYIRVLMKFTRHKTLLVEVGND